MTIYSQAFEVEQIPSLNTREALIREVLRGLLTRPRSLAPWMFYDTCGSRLFERITKLPEYYVTRTEHMILANFADSIIASACADKTQPVRLLELGAGTASKTVLLLDAIASRQSEVLYVPVDVSSDALDVAREKDCFLATCDICSTCRCELCYASTAARTVRRYYTGNLHWFEHWQLLA